MVVVVVIVVVVVVVVVIVVVVVVVVVVVISMQRDDFRSCFVGYVSSIKFVYSQLTSEREKERKKKKRKARSERVSGVFRASRYMSIPEKTRPRNKRSTAAAI
jgi:ABC-type lipoprotein release transport system permease subunit